MVFPGILPFALPPPYYMYPLDIPPVSLYGDYMLTFSLLN